MFILVNLSSITVTSLMRKTITGYYCSSSSILSASTEKLSMHIVHAKILAGENFGEPYR